MPDIDIDFLNRDDALGIIKHIPATITDGVSIKKHNTGVYCHEIPLNPLTNTASIDYKEAENRGYFKLDFLNVSVYKGVRDEEHLYELMNKEPLWELLEQKEFTEMLFQLSGHHYVLSQMKPKSIAQLAAVLAMIRPAKKHLIGKSWNEVMADVWVKPDSDEYFFKRSHATAYAIVIGMQMNLICETLNSEALAP